MDSYDVVIIGAGIGGLLSGAFLAQKGYKVAIFEKEKYAGGLCSSFKSDGYTFDVAVDSIGALKEGELLKTVFNKLGVDGELDFIQLQPVRRNIFPDFRIDIPSSIEEYKEKLKELFSAEQNNLDSLFLLMEEIYAQSTLTALRQVDNHQSQLYEWIGKSFQMLLDSFVHDLRLKAALSSYCTFLGLPAPEASAIAAVNTFMHFTDSGAFRIRGGIQKLPEALVAAIKRNNGNVFLGEKIIQVLIDQGRAMGIATQHQRQVKANHIISSIDVKTLVNSMVQNDAIDKDRLSQLNKLEVSAPFVVIYAGTDMNFSAHDVASSMGYFSSYDTGAMLNNGNELTFGLSIPSLLDDSLSPTGKHTLIIHLPLSEYNASTDKKGIAKKLLERLDYFIPEFSRHIHFQKIADAETFHRYTGNYRGAAYGWKQKVGMYDNLPALKNVLDNFYIVGHWAGFGGGIMPSAISSLRVVEEITGDRVRLDEVF